MVQEGLVVLLSERIGEKREREEFIFASEETYRMNQKAMAKPYSITLNLH